MPTRKFPLSTLAFVAAAALALPYVADSVPCDSNAAARGLLAASAMDGYLNPSSGEDLDFLYRDNGFPNIMVLFDASAAMQMLPPDGPGHLGSLAPTYPPEGVVHYLTNVADDTQVDSPRVVGCGLDPVSSGATGWASYDFAKTIDGRAFYPPCSVPALSSLANARYQGQSTNYAAAMGACPHLKLSGDTVEYGIPGYDPDFYSAANPMDPGGNNSPNFFATDLVIHDNGIQLGALGYANNKFGHNFGDGWSDTAVHPFKATNSAPGTRAQFCATQTGTQGGVTRASICQTCLDTKGWYFDGFILGSSGTYSGQYPSIWYTGNYLNFFPPKFLSARKIVKDVIANQLKVRMALAKTVDAGASVFQDFNPSCGMPEGSSFQNNRSTYAKSLNTDIQFTGSTRPLSKALLDLGKHYHSPTLPWFSATGTGSYNANQAAICSVCQVSTVILISGGIPTLGEGSTTLPTGTTTAGDVAAGLYAGATTTGVTGIATGTGTNTVCTRDCAAFTGAEDYLNNLPRVAWYLQNMDLRENSEVPLDCTPMGGVQRIQTYTLGFGTAQNPKAGQVLQHTANAGGGIAVAAEDPTTLKDRLNQLLTEISTRSTSFSVATISTLQTTAGRAVIVPRFDPNKTANWQGHLFRFDLYSEFVNGCTPGGAGDLDCDNKCESVFLQDLPTAGSDATRSLVGEDGTGAFVRNDPPEKALCTQAPACASTACARSGSAPAVPFWDAGAKLAARSWKTRNIYTATDDSGPAGTSDGRIDRYDTTFALIDTASGAVSATAAQKIVPYLGLGSSATGGSVCAEISNLLIQAGDTANAATVAASPLECAKTVIRYIAGADVFNELGNPAPAFPRANQDDLPDRHFKLGDIFHSSPQVVDPPLPREGILCNLGLSVQCLPSLWATPTDGGAAGYDGFSLSNRYYNRDKFILVGANDGLLHAFNAGTWRAGVDDLYTSAVDESQPPFNGHFDRGTAEELWAFVPPDLISKLPLLMKTVHQYYVDGTAMVRDVWADGSSNQMAAATPPDDVKQRQEFHTVAVVGERRGGTRFFALDVTNADGVGSTRVDGVTYARMPKFLWVYPQPGDKESLTFGETYDDFLPSPPPIAPVRLGLSSTGDDALHGKTPSVNVPGALANTTTSTPYHERWVAFLNGGFDPQYVRGRGVHMVDVWAGTEIFDFSYPNRSDLSVDPADPRRNLRFPVPGTIGMSAWGLDAVRRESAPTHDFLFDTATFSDAGGQLWALRFFTPGHLGDDGKVDNWFGARVFQMGLVGDCKLCSGQPIFVITGDASIAPPGELDHVYRTFFGTGDRFNLLDLHGGVCGPNNIRACVMRGCTVDVTSTDNYVQAYGVGSAQRGLSHGACTATPTLSETDTAFTTCSVDGRAKITISNCPGSGSTLLSTTKDMGANCLEDANGNFRCTPTGGSPGDDLPIDPVAHPINVGNWFLSLLVWEKNTSRDLFWDLDGAKRYDAARVQINQLGMASYTATPGVVIHGASENPATIDPASWANVSSKGWALYYDHDGTQTIDYHQFTVDWRDERTTAGAAFGPNGIVTWKTTQTPSSAVTSTLAAAGGCRVSKCTAEARRLSYNYNANALTGAPVFYDAVAGKYVRARKGYQQVPESSDQKTVFINQMGQVVVGLPSVNPEKGATNVGQSEPVDPTQDAGFIEIDRDLHACRHADGVTTQPVCR